MAKPLKCDLCDSQATVHLTQIVNNQIHKIDLCESCAEAKGITDPNGYSLADLLVKPPANEEVSEPAGSLVCSKCGYTQREFKKTGRVGCPSCYEAFSGLIRPALETMHKGENHRGKVPLKAMERRSYEDRLNELELDLKTAIEEEQYEDAAKFRDEIIELKKSLAAQEIE
ncbi:UvrB/UvrC motif-containing protein [Puniceicoccaceae bacterium K14]|nr:UvrB/UvrC motif-containing protein [Puniceicoccaceae bacterium K14]